MELGRYVVWDVLCEGPVLVYPLLPSSVHQNHVLDSVVLEVPEGVGCEPVVEIAVEDELRIVSHSCFSKYFFKLSLGQNVSLDGVVEVLPPIEEDRARNVPEA